MLLIVWLVVLYFAIGIVARSMASKEILWCFQPAGTLGFVQKKKNEKKAQDPTQQATPASGSEIIDVICGVPGMKIDRSSDNLMKYEVVPGREFHRRGIMYYLYGLTWLGPFNGLRTVKIREVRLSFDKEAKRYVEGEKTHETKFVYYSREHDVATLGAETAGAFELDVYSKLVYFEKFPVKARLKVSDPNATLKTLVDSSVINMTGGEQPEFYLFEDTPKLNVQDKLKERREKLRTTVQDDVKAQAPDLIGIEVERFILYSIEMEEKQRALFKLQEETDRVQRAKILEAERQIEVATKEAERARVVATGERDATKLKNEGEADHVNTVILPIAQAGEQAVKVRGFEAYENNKHVVTYAPGADVMIGGK